MTADARISIGLPQHPKTKKLIRLHGQAAAWNLVCLYLWAAQNRSDGDLSGLSSEDIELAADWHGEPGEFVGSLVAVRFLDGEPGAYELHDWQDHNPWATGSKQRQAKAKWNAAKRHHGEAEADRLVPDYAAIRHAASNATSTPTSKADSKPSSSAGESVADANSSATSNAPSPSPSPFKEIHTPPAGGLSGFDRFWATWPKHFRKGAKSKCLTVWRRAGLESVTETVLEHVERLKRSADWTKDGGAYIPAPLVYLNGRRWEGADIPPEASNVRRLVL